MERFKMVECADGWAASYYPYPKKGYHGAFAKNERLAIESLRQLMNIDGQFRLPDRIR